MRTKNSAFKSLLFTCVAVGVVALAVLLVYVVTKGAPRLNFDLLRRFPSSLPRRAGARSAIFGTIWVVGLTAAFCLPVGIGAAIYLEEFANRDRWWNKLIEVNIQNLAAVPSIVYGILGLGFLVHGIGDLGRTVLAAALTLSLLVFPIVVIASREAIRAVPNSIRLGALALGATPWQAIRTQVLPAAVPGIATGSILALSRAIGEAAPLLLVGGITFITFNPSALDSEFTVLPIQIFNWISRPQPEFKVLAAAAIIVLVGILLAMNSVAIWLRNRYQRKW
ncbi:MAG TPA: phosphate ABC transporter permease PstA [Dehalococcoidia bacterium]|nr:phosphate ABC transporter permease PstA [Dehalococcoidia bacterium]